jgi:hypothetical protein
VQIKEGDKWKAAFITNRGLFEPLVMFFGLTNSPVTFQTMMNHLFKELITRGSVVVYMDDILIFTETIEAHCRVVREVLQILADNNLYLKPEQCNFEKDEIDYLGLKVSHDKIMMDPIKVAGIKDWPTPRTVTEVCSFIGFCNFYRRFICDFSRISQPLHNLMTKDARWEWGTAEIKAFDMLKCLICAHPILVFPDDNCQYMVEVDSSNYATGAILSQLWDDNKWHPIAFLSKSLSPAERNYNIYDKEMLAVI